MINNGRNSQQIFYLASVVIYIVICHKINIVDVYFVTNNKINIVYVYFVSCVYFIDMCFIYFNLYLYMYT